MLHILKRIALTGIKTEAPPLADDELRVSAQRLKAQVLGYFAGALTIRHVDAGLL
jgi:hypothetical protein